VGGWRDVITISEAKRAGCERLLFLERLTLLVDLVSVLLFAIEKFYSFLKTPLPKHLLL
jgi:hypothetical protein